MLLNYLLKCQSKRQSVSEIPSDETMNADTPDSVTPDILKSGAMTPDTFTPDAEDPLTEHHVLSGTSDQQLTSKLSELANHVNGTQLPLTRNGIDGVVEPVDEGKEEQEGGEKEERDKERREALSDMEVDVGQKNSEIKEDEDQEVGKGLTDVEVNEIETKTLMNLETQSTNVIDNLHNEIFQEIVEKQSALETDGTARMSLEECFDYQAEMDRNNLNKRILVDQNVEQETKDRSESKGGDDSEPEPVQNPESIKEPEAKCLLETPVESCEKDESQECRKQKKDTEYEAESIKDNLDNTGSENRMNNEKESLTYSQDNLDFVEEENSEYKQMTENVVMGSNIMEEETEAQISNTSYSILDLTDDSCKEMEEKMGKQIEQNQMTQDNEMGFHNERIARDEQTQEDDMENESNFVGKTEEHSCVAEAEQCNHTLKDVLDYTTSGQEEFLSAEEIYKVRFVLFYSLCIDYNMKNLLFTLLSLLTLLLPVLLAGTVRMST